LKPTIYSDDSVKAIVSVPGWVNSLDGSNKGADTPSGAFGAVPILYRAVNLRCQSLSVVPYVIHSGDNEVEWPFEEDLSELMYMMELALMISGVCYVLKIREGLLIQKLKWMNPTTMKWERNRDGENVYTQKIGDKTYGPWSDDEMLVMRQPSMASDIGPGLAPAQVAANAARMRFSMDEFTAAFFEHGAQPLTLLTTTAKIKDDERDRTERYFRRSITGVKNAWRALMLRADIKVTNLSPEIKSMEMPATDKRTILDIGAALDVPRSILESDAANYATSESDLSQFWEMTIRPRLPMYQRVINKSLFGDSVDGLQLKFMPENLAIFQEDEAARSTSLLNLTKAGVQLEEAMAMLGYNPLENLPERIEPTETEPDTEVENELRAWQNYALRRVGTKNGRPFTPKFIEGGVALKIQGQINEATLKEHIREIFSNVVAAKLQPQDIDGITNEIKDETADKHLRPITEDTIGEAGEGTMEGIYETAGRTALAFDSTHARMTKYLSEEFGARIKLMTDTTKQEIRDILLGGISDGVDFTEMSSRIRTKFKDFSRHRSNAIARTEVGGASNFGVDEGMRQTGIVGKRRWIASFINTRPTHADLHEVEVGIDEPFETAGKQTMRPGNFGLAEEDINCQCTIVAASFVDGKALHFDTEQSSRDFEAWKAHVSLQERAERKMVTAADTMFDEIEVLVLDRLRIMMPL
jgi:HK97 family phage portal protein